MKEFRLQPKILFGEDSLDYLKTLEYKKIKTEELRLKSIVVR